MTGTERYFIEKLPYHPDVMKAQEEKAKKTQEEEIKKAQEAKTSKQYIGQPLVEEMTRRYNAPLIPKEIVPKEIANNIPSVSDLVQGAGKAISTGIDYLQNESEKYYKGNTPLTKDEENMKQSLAEYSYQIPELADQLRQDSDYLARYYAINSDQVYGKGGIFDYYIAKGDEEYQKKLQYDFDQKNMLDKVLTIAKDGALRSLGGNSPFVPRTGNAWIDTPASLIGGLAGGSVTPGLGAGGAFGASATVGTKAVSAVSPKIAQIMKSPLPNTTATNIAKNIGAKAVEGAATMAPYSISTQSLLDPNASETEQWQNLGLSTLMGAGMGAGLGLAGTGFSKVKNVFKPSEPVVAPKITPDDLSQFKMPETNIPKPPYKLGMPKSDTYRIKPIREVSDPMNPNIEDIPSNRQQSLNFDDRMYYGKISKRDVNAYQFDNPEVKPFYKEYASYFLENEFVPHAQKELYPSKAMELLKEKSGLTPKNVKDGLERIIEDNGKENVANAKKIEVSLDYMLSNGIPESRTLPKGFPPVKKYLEIKSKLEGKQYTEPKEIDLTDLPHESNFAKPYQQKPEDTFNYNFNRENTNAPNKNTPNLIANNQGNTKLPLKENATNLVQSESKIPNQNIPKLNKEFDLYLTETNEVADSIRYTGYDKTKKIYVGDFIAQSNNKYEDFYKQLENQFDSTFKPRNIKENKYDVFDEKEFEKSLDTQAEKESRIINSKSNENTPSNTNSPLKENATNLGQSETKVTNYDYKTLPNEPKQIETMLNDVKSKIADMESKGLDHIIDENGKKWLKVDLQLFAQKAEEKLMEVSKFKSNTIEKSGLTDTPEMKEVIDDVDMNYEVKPHETSIKLADENLKNDYDGTYKRILENGAETSEDTVAAKTIMNNLKNALKENPTDIKIASKIKKIAKALQEKFTSMGQTIEALKLWQPKTAEGAIIKAEKIVQKTEEKIKKQSPQKIKDIDKQSKEVNDIIKQSEKKAINDVTKEIEDSADDIIKKAKSTKNKSNKQPESIKEEQPNILKAKDKQQPKKETTPEEQLARRIEKTARVKVNPNYSSFDPETKAINEMVNELYNKFSETLPKSLPVNQANKIQAIAKAIRERSISAEVWNKAKDIVRQKLGKDTAALKYIDDYFGKGTNPPFAESTLNQAINQGLKNNNFKISEIVKKYYAKGINQRGELVDDIVKHSGLSGDDARILADYIQSNINKRIKTYSESYLERIFKEKASPKAQNSLNDIEAISNTGGFLNENYNTRILDKINPKIANIIRQSGIKMNELVRLGLKETEFNKVKFMEDLTNNLNIKPEDALQVVRAAENVFNEMAKKSRNTILTNMFKTKKPTVKKNTTDKVLELINLGAYDDVAIRDLIKQKNGIPILEQSDIKNIVDIMDNISGLDKRSWDYRAGISKVEQIISNKLLPDAGDKIKSLIRTSWLGQALGRVRDVSGNTLVGTVESLANNLFAIPVDKVLSRIRGSERNYIFDPIGKGKASLFGKVQGIKELGKDIKYGVDTNPVKNIDYMQGGNPFSNNNPIGMALNKADKITKVLVSAPDRPFTQGAYEARIKELQTIRKTKEITPEIDAEAKEWAMERYFQGESQFQKKYAGIKNAIEGGEDSNILWKLAANFTMPFTKVPPNMVDRVFEYVGGGIIKSVGHALKAGALKKGTFNQRYFVDRLARGLTGTGLMWAGYSMYNAGMIRGSADTNKRVEAYNQAQGKQPYSLNIGGKSHRIDWLGGAATALLTGADLAKSAKDNKNPIDLLTDAFASGGDTVTKMPMFRNIQALMGNRSPMAGIGNAIIGDTSVAIPSIVGQVNKNIDPYVRETHNTSKTREGINRALISRTPIGSQTLPKRIDAFGNPVMQYEGTNKILNAVNSLFNPVTTKSIKTSIAQDEISRLYDKTGSEAILPMIPPEYVTNPIDGKKIQLTPEEFEQYSIALGQGYEPLVNEVINMPEYKNSTDDADRSKSIKSALELFDSTLQNEFLQSKGIDTKTKKPKTIPSELNTAIKVRRNIKKRGE